MKESDWLNTTSRPITMFRHVRNKFGLRKPQLLSCAICQLVWEHITDPRLRTGIQTYERFVDGQVSDEEMSAAVLAARDVLGWTVENGIVRPPVDTEPLDSEEAARFAVNATLNGAPGRAVEDVIYLVQECAYLADPGPVTPRRIAASAYDRQICELFREIIGNPFRPWKAVPDFLGGGVMQPDGKTVRLTDTARRLAEGIRADQGFDRLPILADALEEAGVTDAELLAHCRRDGGHVRGCWALDVVLGKA
jgi:hypothetical protein